MVERGVQVEVADVKTAESALRKEMNLLKTSFSSSSDLVRMLKLPEYQIQFLLMVMIMRLRSSLWDLSLHKTFV